MTIAAQIVVYIDDQGVFRAEMPSKNGLRKRIELRDGEWEAVLRSELWTASEFARANREENQRVRDAIIRQSNADRTNRIARDIYENIAANHGRGLADHAVPSQRGHAKRMVKKAASAARDFSDLL